jgi:hypothetical protein
VGAAGALLNEAAKAMGQKPTRPGGPAAPGTSSSSETGKRNEDPDAAARAARQLAAIEENGEIERAKKMELERNVDLAIKAFIDKLIEWHNAINTGAAPAAAEPRHAAADPSAALHGHRV